ncbi:MAG: hypothetical protein AAFV93_21375, partial [Chloroflexota bacterium]
MKLSTDNLALAHDAVIDLQLHTNNSDGQWTAEALIDYLISEGFGLAAITDHDRADIASDLQSLAIAKQFPLLVAVEISSMWQGELTDFLCYGFNPTDNALLALSEEVAQRQYENTRLVVENLRKNDYAISEDDLVSALAKPSCQQLIQKLADK